MKKLIVFSLVALMAISSVFAGGSKEAASDNGVKTLTFAVWDYTQNAYLSKAIAAFEAANPDIKIEVQDSPAADYITKLNTQLNGGSDVDLFLIKEADKTKTFYDRGQLANLTPYVEASGIDMSAYNGTDANFTFDGNLYAMPLRTDQYVLFYNKDLFDAAGVPYPDNDMTWAEFEELVDKCTWEWTSRGGHDGYEVTGPNGKSIFLPAAGWRFGTSLYLAGVDGSYWSSTPNGGNTQHAYNLYFSSGSHLVDWYASNLGRSVRPVSDK